MKTIYLVTAAIIYALTPVVSTAAPKLDEQAVEQLRSIDWHIREHAFRTLVPSQAIIEKTQDVQLKNAVLQLAQTEIKLSNKIPSDGSEEYSEYLANIINTICKMHDPIFLDVLFNPEFFDTGNMVTRGIASLGDAAIKNEATALGVTSGMSELSAVGVATQMLEQKTVHDPANLDLLRSSLLDKSRSSNRLVRSIAVKGLSHFDDPAAIQRISEIASGDPYEALVDGVVRYPVREQATAVLAKASH